MFTAFILFLFLSPSAFSLRCSPCEDQLFCQPIDVSDCASEELVTDVCDCCDVCAKAKGERCGGVWNTFGKCASYLRCHPPYDPQNPNESGTCVSRKGKYRTKYRI